MQLKIKGANDMIKEVTKNDEGVRLLPRQQGGGCPPQTAAGVARRQEEDSLDGAWATVHEQKWVAGPHHRYLECRVEDDELIIERKRNALSFTLNREGMFRHVLVRRR